MRPCYCPLAHALSIYDKSERSSKFTADRPPRSNVTRGLAIAPGPGDRRILGTPSWGYFESQLTYNAKRKCVD